jgi:predicted nuclease with RNAse H fold
MIRMEKLNEAGVEVVLVYPDAPNEKYKNSQAWLIERLKR